MTHSNLIRDLILPYCQIDYINDDDGHIVWRYGTGGNIELLHLKSVEPGQGSGKKLFVKMLQRLIQKPPYSTVFGFTRTCNVIAQSFYVSMGFTTTYVTGVYGDGEAILFSAPFKVLKEKHNV